MQDTIIEPEDLHYLDFDRAKDDEDKPDLTELPTKRQIILFLITILLFITGYFIAPSPMDDGS